MQMASHGKGESLRVAGYVRLLTVLGLVGVVAVGFLELGALGVAWPDLVALALVSVVAAMGLDEEPVDAVEIGMAAGMVVVGPFASVLLAAVVSPISSLAHRSGWLQAGYHFGRRVVPAVVAAAAYALVVPVPRMVDLGRNAGAYLIVGLVWSAVALAVRARYFATITSTPVLRSLRLHARPGFGPLVVSLPMGLAVASLFQANPAAVVVLLLPAVLGRKLTAAARVSAERDPTTGFDLPHRLWERLHEEMVRAQRQGHPLGVVILVLENLDALRRVLGEEGMRTVLQEVARAVRTELRRSDYVAHLSEDRLACLLPGAAVEQAERVATRIRSEVAMRTPTRVSFGVTAYTGGTQEPSAVLNAAERGRKAGDQVARG